jgi:hypothetical protein
VTIYQVDEHHRAHICPADPQPHTITIERTIVHITDGGPCRTPVTIRCGNRTVVIPCGRHEPAHRQCAACRVIITTGTVTVEHLGAVSRTGVAITREPAVAFRDLRCDVCNESLDPVLANTGRHLLCYPVSRRSRAAA